MTKMAGSDTSSKNGILKCREGGLIHGVMNYDIYAAYCEANRHDVHTILETLKRYQLCVRDSLQNVLLGK